MAKAKIINVLYVDDEPNNLITFTANFKNDFNIYLANNATEAEIVLANKVIHVLITDQRMPGKLGTELLAESVQKYPQQIRILLTALGNTKEIKEAVNKGHVFRSLEKPMNDEELRDAVKVGYESYLWIIARKKIKDDLNDEQKED